MLTTTLLGFLGAIMFGLCGIPQCIKTYKDKNAESLSWMFLLLWMGGTLFTTAYIVLVNISMAYIQWPLYLNYIINFCVITYLLYAKYKY